MAAARREGLKGSRSSLKLRRRVRPPWKVPQIRDSRGKSLILEGARNQMMVAWCFQVFVEKAAEAEASGTRVTVTSKSRKSDALFPVRFRCQGIQPTNFGALMYATPIKAA